MEILQAKTQDMIRKAYQLRFEVFVKEQNVPIELEIDEYDKTATHVVAIDEKSGECIGCGRLVIENGIAKIGRIAIKKGYRKKGYGKKIGLKLIDIAQKINVGVIMLNAQLSVVGFYKKLGFKECGDIFMDANIEHISMKLLNPKRVKY